MPDENRSIPELFSNSLSQFARLMRDELRLARAEMANSLSQAATGVGMLAASSVVMIATVVLLLLAFAAWLANLGLPVPLADFVAAVVGSLIGGTLALLGINRLRRESLTPKRTLEQLQLDAAAAEEQVR